MPMQLLSTLSPPPLPSPSPVSLQREVQDHSCHRDQDDVERDQKRQIALDRAATLGARCLPMCRGRRDREWRRRGWDLWRSDRAEHAREFARSSRRGGTSRHSWCGARRWEGGRRAGWRRGRRSERSTQRRRSAKRSARASRCAERASERRRAVRRTPKGSAEWWWRRTRGDQWSTRGHHRWRRRRKSRPGAVSELRRTKRRHDRLVAECGRRERWRPSR